MYATVKKDRANYNRKNFVEKYWYYIKKKFFILIRN